MEKAEAVWQAWRLAFGARPKRSIVEGLLDAVYNQQEARSGLPLAGVWTVYEDWIKGKSRVLAKLTLQKRRRMVERFAAWAEGKSTHSVGDVSVGIVREFVAWYKPGRANKSARNAVGDLLTVWDALSQMDGSVHNPWRAALPDDDGSSVALSPFSVEEDS